jgi:fused signal recognition particle receptor
MAILVLLGVLGTVVYYVARYSFKTDYEKDLEKALSEKTDSRKAAEEILKPPGAAPEPLLAKVPEAPAARKKNLSEALSNTKESFFGRIRNLFASGMAEADMEALEEILYTSDLGPETVERMMEAIQEKMDRSDVSSLEKVREALREEMHKIFSTIPFFSMENWIEKVDSVGGPYVILVVGVNGAGKTTTIGKLAHWFASQGRTTLVAAGDTFRAAAGDQLKVWSERAQVEIFSPAGVSDPSAVAFDACQKAKSKNFKVVIVDTAGRLHTQKNLMEELAKMKRTVQKVIPEGPHETLLVLDSNSGQNALMQARQFHDALQVSGVVLTKLDGTAKGGVAVGIVNELGLPIQLVGIGEGIADLRPFDSKEFVDSIL